MAIQSRELYGTAVPQLKNLRAYPHADGIAVGQLEALAADADVAHLTPLRFTAGTWGVWVDADVNTITGFLWAPDVAHAGLLAGETLIQVLKRGVIDARDVPLNGQTQATLDTALEQQSLRDAGMTVKGLSGVA